MPNILIMPTPLRHRPGRYRSLLDAAGFRLIDPPGTGRLSADDLSASLPESDALLAWGAPITRAMMASAPRLRAIARAGAGHDAVDLTAATARRIAVTTTPGANAESVAEQVFALLLSLTRRVISNDQSVRAGGWDRRPLRPLRGTTLGIVGLGRCGRAVARRALAFGMRVVACCRRADINPGADPAVVRLALEDVLDQSDVVSLHLSLSAATRGLFDRRAFARMRPGALFINTARGGLVVEADLIEGLACGHLGGAGLDALDAEPPRPGNPLLAMPNVVFSPHIAGVDATALDDMSEQAARCVIALYRGNWPEGYVLNEELRPEWRWSIE
jgi:phosphoglycerate dehydrogenase-like enzyme